MLSGFTDDPATLADGVNTVEWIDDWEARGFPAQSTAHTDVQFSRVSGGQWFIAEADIYLNRGLDWTLAPDQPGRDVTAVLTHELGHLLGLLHPCELESEPMCAPGGDVSVSMYPVYSSAQATLAPDDVEGVCFLYPAPSCQVTGCSDDLVCNGDLCQAPCGDEFCATGLLCVESACVEPPLCPSRSCVGRACQSDAQCGEFEQCPSGACTRGPRTEGQLCATSDDCAAGLCVDGLCQTSCVSVAGCDARASCVAYDATHSICERTGGELGAECSTPLDCRGRRCLGNAKPHPICTTPCGEHYPVCEAGWACGLADGEEVCVPVRVSGGCALAGEFESSFPFEEALLLGFVFFASRRVKRAFSRRNPSC